ncbi:alkaline phosphatase family protein [Dethiosulfatarculus sandiegensis]|uniref:Phosphoglycerate mutase n=1 Tax=Dethiosulfatarculus sandiegensis TaxID=1429043 RepID=A0A0D2J8U3_9BACT|nr:alkaline phosphatase family protein [Dethiosulfatarculus sandiegensis]KIX14584.1 phosphoglycerate mutase [Dethiosulfatarculus sandiegensis]
MPSRCLLVLLDGLSDRSHKALAGDTPLAFAHTPNLDRLAGLGSTGLYHGAMVGQALPSEEAHFSLFGYSPAEFPGRGLLEAMGAEIDITENRVYLLARLLSLFDNQGRLLVKEYKPALAQEAAAELFQQIERFSDLGMEARLVPTKGLESVLVLGPEASPHISDSSPLGPGKNLQKVLPLAKASDPALAEKTAGFLNRYLLWSYETLKEFGVKRELVKAGENPVNGLATQRPGQVRPVQPFEERWGLKGAIVASGLIYLGLGRLLGMRARAVGETDNCAKDLAQRLEEGLFLLKDHDFVHVHTKAPDEAGHKKDPMLKKSIIENLDKGFGGLMERILDDPELLVVVTSDHATPSAGPLIHSGEPVPFLCVGNGVWQDQVERFDEVSCAAGAFGLLRGPELMHLLLNWLDRVKLRGLFDTAHDQPYWPGNAVPLTLPGKGG